MVILFWRRTDVIGLERLALTVSSDRIVADATVVCLEDDGFEIRHRWSLTPDWRTQSLEVERSGAEQPASVVLNWTAALKN